MSNQVLHNLIMARLNCVKFLCYPAYIFWQTHLPVVFLRPSIVAHTSTESILISAFVFSAFSSSSTFSSAILGLVYFFGCISNPAYENVFLNATPPISRESYKTTHQQFNQKDKVSLYTNDIFRDD